MDELKSCPFCGILPIKKGEMIYHQKSDGLICPCENREFAPVNWNTRPSPEGLEEILDIIDGYKVEEVHTMNIKSKTDFKDFVNQHIDEIKKSIAERINPTPTIGEK